ncbi:MAG: hypothetical protein HEQ37_19260 [Acidovorax sp.]|nr:hypothetical protein [Acidovorax sp.]
MGVAYCALKTSQDAGSAVGHDELELGRRAAKGYQAVVRTAAVLVDVGLKLPNRANQALRQLLGQGRQLSRLLRLAAELHPLNRFVLLRVAAGQDGPESLPFASKVPAGLDAAG